MGGNVRNTKPCRILTGGVPNPTSNPVDHEEIVNGSLEDGRFAVWYLEGPRVLVGCMAWLGGLLKRS